MAEGEYVKEFDKCPNCGCRETITRKAWDSEIDAGRLAEKARGYPVGAENTMFALQDPLKPPAFQVGALLISYDICSDCGTKYCVRVEKKVMPVTGKMPGQGQQGPFPFGNLRGN
jgi:hypothetical protein